MKKNMGTADRVIRVLIALAIVVLYALGLLSGTWMVVLLIVSVIFFLTSLVSTCPLYLPFGLRTNRNKARDTSH